jgi:hypothetical protein
MDIKESFCRILEQKQAVTHRFFAVARGSGHETRFVFWRTEEAGVSAESSSAPRNLKTPLELYAHFTNDLLRTLQEFHGADWNGELMEQWRLAIERVGHAIFTAREKADKS